MRKKIISILAISLAVLQMVTPVLASVSVEPLSEETNNYNVEESNLETLNTDDVLNIGTVESVATDSDASKLITGMLSAEDQQNWENYVTYWSSEQQSLFKLIFQHPEFFDNNEGVSTVRSAKVASINKISEDLLATEFVDSILFESYQDIEIYLVGVDYTVEKVTEYYYNGVNYFLVVTGLEAGIRKIIAEPEPSIEFLVKLKQSSTYELQGLNEALEVRRARTYGIIIDSNNEIISYNSEDIESSKIAYEKSKMARAISYSCTHVLPSSVKIMLRDGRIETKNFAEYSKIVLCSEMNIGGNYENALAAQLIALRQFAVYYTSYRHRFTGYDLVADTRDQQYNPNKYSKELTQAERDYIDIVFNAYSAWHMETSTGYTFCSHYAYDEAAEKIVGENCMLQYQLDGKGQWGAQGKWFQEMLHSSYNNQTEDGVALGKIKFAVYSGTPLGWKLADCKYSKRWYYFNTNQQIFIKGWKQISGKTYYFDDYGRMAESGWQKIGSNWYWIVSDGSRLINDWVEDPKGSNRWYWLASTGQMAASKTLLIRGRYYDFNASGLCLNNAGRTTK